MSTYNSFDPREKIRTKIGYSHYMNGHQESTVSVTDNENTVVYLPLLFPDEARGQDSREMPFIEMTLMSQPCTTHNISGDAHIEESYVDLHIYYTNTDNITPNVFGKAVADEIVDKITQNRHDVNGTVWIEVINKGREQFEQAINGTMIVFHRIIEVYCVNYTHG
jgi:hypothetical protein